VGEPNLLLLRVVPPQHCLVKYNDLSRATSSSFTDDEHLCHAVTLLQLVGTTFSVCILANYVSWAYGVRGAPYASLPRYGSHGLGPSCTQVHRQCSGIVEAPEVLLLPCFQVYLPGQVLFGLLFPCLSKYTGYLAGTLTCSQFPRSLCMRLCSYQVPRIYVFTTFPFAGTLLSCVLSLLSWSIQPSRQNIPYCYNTIS